MIEGSEEEGFWIKGYCVKEKSFEQQELKDAFLYAYHATGVAGERTGQLLGAYLNGELGYLPEEFKSGGEKSQEETVQVFGKYKPVAKKVRPVLGTTPEEFRIERNIIGDPLKDMPPLNPNPPEFRPTG
ncbi:hypothetical protein C0989_000482, partial [Termitomyces sp. Mn162]